MDNAPFYVGQKVVRIKDNPFIPKGTIVTVFRCFKCPNCKEWSIVIKEYGKTDIATKRACLCGHDNHDIAPEPNLSGNAKYFAPIDPEKEQAEISESLIEQAKELIQVKETIAPVLEPVKN